MRILNPPIGSTSVEGGSVWSPDDILEQSEFADATLSLTCDPIGRLMVAMRIVSPADKKGSGADFPHAMQRWRQSPARPLRLHEGTKRSGDRGRAISSGLEPKLRAARLASPSRRDLSRSGG